MQNSKSILREQFLEKRLNINELDASSSALQAAHNFVNNVNLDKIKTIALYHPINGEIDPLPLMNILHKQNIIFCLPHITVKNAPLAFYAWKRDDALENNQFYPQLLEPKERPNPIIPDIIIVPVVAFDEQLHRIGYGAGFYDRTLRRLKEKNNSILALGYAFEAQKCPRIPADDHDIKLDFIVTDKKVYRG